MAKKSKKKQKKNKKQKKAPRFTAASADKHELYQLSVQSPDTDVEFLEQVYREERKGKDALHFREDFCGTAILSSYWLRRGEQYTAEGFDIDPDPLAWGRKNVFEPLGDELIGRMNMHQSDVRAPSEKKPDVRCAQNFSYCALHTRAELIEYFKSAYEDLADDGIFVLDIHGGAECFEEMEEETELEEGFTYVWDQDEFYPVTHEAVNYIHFRFKDGTEMDRAFTYHWRLWMFPEVVDALKEVGFQRVDPYWEGTDEEDEEEGNGEFTKTERGENDLSWVAYIVAHK